MPSFLHQTGVALATLFVGSVAFAGRLPEEAIAVVDYDISVRLDAEKKELTGRERIVWRNPATDPRDGVSDL